MLNKRARPTNCDVRLRGCDVCGLAYVRGGLNAVLRGFEVVLRGLC